MKVKEAQFARALDAPAAQVKLYLAYGPDESGSRAFATRLEKAMGADAERIDLDGATLKEDPARLADEAASISLFGGARHIRVTGGDECTPAVLALLEGIPGNPVVMVAGALKPSSTLLKATLDHPDVLACISYKPEGREADELAVGIGRIYGLRLSRTAAQALAANCLGDRAILEREIEKLALYLDAAPDRPRDADTDALDAIGADLGEFDTSRLVDAALGGKLTETVGELSELAASGGEIPALRGLTRRLMILARLRGEVEGGKSSSNVMASSGKSLFYKERDAVGAELSRWDAARLRTAATRVFAAEQALKTTKSAGEVLVAAELIAIARAAERLR